MKEPVPPAAREIRKIAREVFHYRSLRSGQEEAIAAIMAGRDTLAVMPTGHGKSAIYQIPTLLLPRPAIVVSPLLALQKDQSEFLNDEAEVGAAAVNSLMPESAREEAIAGASEGKNQFLFLAPEQFADEERMGEIAAIRPSLFVVDEAHCISEWGHSFRPDYLRLGSVIQRLGHPTVLALTATANEIVRQEIVSRLGMRRPKIIVHGFDRPNIWLGVETAASEDKKHTLLLDWLSRSRPSGIIYTSTRRHAEQIKGELESTGRKAAFYHGGLKKSDREAMQERFMSDEVEVIVATCAFGMGVDKPNVRFVFHYDAPGSLDAYYQEIGRSGRDGEPSSAVLFFCPRDLALHKFFKAGDRIGEREIYAVVEALAKGTAVAPTSLAQTCGVSPTKLKRVLQALSDFELIAPLKRGMVRIAVDNATLAARAKGVVEAQAQFVELQMNRIEQMRQYAANLNCRREFLLRYFGEEYSGPCHNCDNCEGQGTTRAEVIAETRKQAEASPPERSA